jgi:hypothetical protein
MSPDARTARLPLKDRGSHKTLSLGNPTDFKCQSNDELYFAQILTVKYESKEPALLDDFNSDVGFEAPTSVKMSIFFRVVTPCTVTRNALSAPCVTRFGHLHSLVRSVRHTAENFYFVPSVQIFP